MSQFKRLLVMLGPQMRYTPALQRAAALAESSGALLDINVFVDDVDTFGLMSDGRERERLLADNRQWLADATEQLRDDGLDVSTELLLTRDPLGSVIERIEQLGCDLLIKDVQHEPVLKRLLVTPLDWQLLKDSPVAVHLVSDIRLPLPRQIAVAVDLNSHGAGEHLDEQVIHCAHALALQCNAELHLLHVCDAARTHLADFGAGTVTMPGFEGSVRTAQRAAFNRLGDHHQIPLERRHFLEGAAIRAIAQFVSHSRVDVIVMGNHRHDAMQTFLGGTTAHVLEHPLCNVLAVKGVR
ncbi:universal stress protein [Pseudomonas putida]|uniref:UspA domain protein n=1 Tax=Pseudomonas putida (strain W619) TaxID=390235 RepID=B1J9H2_PSEPW|nr:universal stress protein [Pseudomonas putida]KHL74704.1 universal stress protein [Pseudomonas putida]QQE81895.1 universal stress protein [Pseudomonas putida]UTL79182.1 universal stress protein [Pseudomonas putida]HEK1692938.1 universal stress protein [Pseudomonas putida]HEN8713086.1 universal stress protein [Pseudomonas putida]